MTKASLEAEAAARETLRKEFLAMQEAVKNTEILIPFVLFDGTSIPAGSVKIKKGDHVWLFLDRCRKVGAELGGRTASGAAKARREWARVSVDDLMLVKGDVIVPHVSFATRCSEEFQLTKNSTMNFTTLSPIAYRVSRNPVVSCSIIPMNRRQLL